MPNDDTLEIRIANGNPTPNGPAAIMSITADGHPNKATFKALDKAYIITLKPLFWLGRADGGSFGLPQGQTSAPIQLALTAPLGKQQPYLIEPGGRQRVPPEIMIEP